MRSKIGNLVFLVTTEWSIAGQASAFQFGDERVHSAAAAASSASAVASAASTASSSTRYGRLPKDDGSHRTRRPYETAPVLVAAPGSKSTGMGTPLEHGERAGPGTNSRGAAPAGDGPTDRSAVSAKVDLHADKTERDEKTDARINAKVLATDARKQKAKAEADAAKAQVNKADRNSSNGG